MSSELEVAEAHCRAAAIAFENVLVHANTAADEAEAARNSLNAAGVGGDAITHASQVQQALEAVQQQAIAGKNDAEQKAAALRAIIEGR